MSDDTLNGASNNGTVVDPCLECGQTVRPRLEAIQCENCSLWQHRTCNTNITRDSFLKFIQEWEFEVALFIGHRQCGERYNSWDYSNNILMTFRLMIFVGN